MIGTAPSRVGTLLAVAIAAFATACAADTPVSPEPRDTFSARLAEPPAVANVGSTNRAVEVGDCDGLQPPAGSRLVFRAYARGVQIYRWNGTGWSFAGPSATLFADADGRGVVGTHFAGPTWLGTSGGRVIGAVRQQCTPDADAIAWLLLDVVASDGPSVFQNATHIQRIATVGGKAPTVAGSVTGEEARVPYTAVYYFHRAP